MEIDVLSSSLFIFAPLALITNTSPVSLFSKICASPKSSGFSISISTPQEVLKVYPLFPKNKNFEFFLAWTGVHSEEFSN